VQVSVTFMEKPWTTNAERRQKHWSQRAKITARWRHAYASVIKMLLDCGYPTAQKIGVTVIPHQEKGKMQDTGSCYPSAKAAIDGLVDGGLIPDDGPQYVDYVLFQAPVKGEHAMTLTINILEFS